MKWLVAVLITVMTLGLMSGAAMALSPDTVWVCVTGDDANSGTQAEPFRTIQRGVNVVATGGTVYVMPSGEGSYEESVLVNKDNLAIVATGAAADTVVESGEDLCFQVLVGNVRIKGFTLSTTSDDAIFFGVPVTGGVVTIADNLIEAAYSGIYFSGAVSAETSVTITGNDIVSGAAAVRFGAIADSNVTISSNSLESTGERELDSQAIHFSDLITASIIEIVNNPAIVASAESDFPESQAILFGDEVVDSSVTISGNDMIESESCSAIDFKLSITESAITISQNEIVAARHGIVFASSTEHTVSDTAITISDNDIAVGERGIYLVCDLEDESTLTVTGNTVSESSRGMEFRHIRDSAVTLEGNTFVASGNGLHFRRVYDSTVSIENNSVTAQDTSSDGVRFSSNVYTSTLRFIDNVIWGGYRGINLNDQYTSHVIMIGNTVTGTYEGINFYDFHLQSTLWVEGNTVIADYRAMRVCCIDEQAVVTFINNDVKANDYGIYLSNRLREQSRVWFEGNAIKADVGMYLGVSVRESSLLTIRDNDFTVSYTGLHISRSIYADATVLISGNTMVATDVPNPTFAGGILADTIYEASVTIADNSIDGFQHGIYIGGFGTGMLRPLAINGTEPVPSTLRINANLITNNDTGLHLGFIHDEPGSVLDLGFNAFAGNGTAVSGGDNGYFLEGFIDGPGLDIDATRNWWGAADGPALPSSGGSGDLVSEGVKFNPWLKTVGLSPANSEQTVDTTVSLAATLLDNRDNRASSSDLWVRFTVSGTNNFTRLVKLNAGRATLEYKSSSTGTDTVTADVLFTGESVGLTGQTRVEWKSATPGLGDLWSGIVVFERKKTEILLTIGSTTVYVNGDKQTIDAPPYIQAGTDRTMVPIRFISEQLGATVFWLEETRQVRIMMGGTDIWLTIGSTTAVVNGKEVAMDSAPEIVDGRTFVPLRFVSETLGAEVIWDQETREITIRK